jgi:ABC-type polar amino acid transport system ATPase subunit
MIEPIVSFQQVHKSFGPLQVLQGIDLAVYPGEKIVLMGHSGCGKSTVLRCVNGLEWIDRGELYVNGVALHQHKSIKTHALNQFRSHIGMVFQQFNLFPHMTVLENIILGPIKVKGVPKLQAIDTAHDLLKRVGIGDKWQVYPDQLSGGQKQRVAIARCLAMRPQMILLDEPTSALDPPMTMEVLQVIRDVAEEGLTLMIVTHECRFAREVADRIIFMHNGRIEEEGRPEQVMDNPISPLAQSYFSLIL